MGDETKDKEVLKGNTDLLSGPRGESSADSIGPTSDAAQLPSEEEAVRQIEQREGDLKAKRPSLDKRTDARTTKL